MVDVFLALYMRDSVLLFFNVFIKNKSVVKNEVTVPHSKSGDGLMEYLEHGPCMTENFCL